MSEATMPTRWSDGSRDERGMALPAALLLLLVIASATAMLSRPLLSQLQTSKRQELTQKLVMVADGAMQDQMRQLLLQPEYWKVMATVSSKPSRYASYQPANFASTNGIPSCTGAGCSRSRYPTGGGLLKNIGDLVTDGASVDTSKTADAQYDADTAPIRTSRSIIPRRIHSGRTAGPRHNPCRCRWRESDDLWKRIRKLGSGTVSSHKFCHFDIERSKRSIDARSGD